MWHYLKPRHLSHPNSASFTMIEHRLDEHYEWIRCWEGRNNDTGVSTWMQSQNNRELRHAYTFKLANIDNDKIQSTLKWLIWSHKSVVEQHAQQWAWTEWHPVWMKKAGLENNFVSILNILPLLCRPPIALIWPWKWFICYMIHESCSQSGTLAQKGARTQKMADYD